MMPAGSLRPAGAACDLLAPLRAPLPDRERIGLGMHLSRSCEVGCLHFIRTYLSCDFYHLCLSFLLYFNLYLAISDELEILSVISYKPIFSPLNFRCKLVILLLRRLSVLSGEA